MPFTYFGFKCSKFYTKLLSHSIWLLLLKWKTKQNLLLGINSCAYCTRAFCEYEWRICWNLISKDSYKQFLRLHRYIASKGVPWRECVCSMYYTMYIISWLGVWRKAVFNAYVLFVSAFFACLYIQLLTAAVSSILYTRYQKRKL